MVLKEYPQGYYLAGVGLTFAVEVTALHVIFFATKKGHKGLLVKDV